MAATQIKSFQGGKGRKKRSDFLHSSCRFGEKPWQRLNAAGCRLMAALNNSPRRDERQVKAKKELVHLTAECGGASSGNLAFLSFLFFLLNGFNPQSISFVSCWLSTAASRLRQAQLHSAGLPQKPSHCGRSGCPYGPTAQADLTCGEQECRGTVVGALFKG